MPKVTYGGKKGKDDSGTVRLKDHSEGTNYVKGRTGEGNAGMAVPGKHLPGRGMGAGKTPKGGGTKGGGRGSNYGKNGF